MEWIFYYLIIHQDFQAKLHKEIDQAFGSRKPSLTERKSTPYLDAFIEEVMRHCPLTNFAIPHVALEDSKIGKYFCPKGTWVI